MTIKLGSAQSIANKSIIAAESLSNNMYTTAPAAPGSVTVTQPVVTGWYITDAAYTNLNPQPLAINTTGGYIRLLGTGFDASSRVGINGVPATTSTVIGTTEIRAQVPALNVTTVTSQVAYVTNLGNNSTGILLNLFKYSVRPSWNISASQGNPSEAVNIPLFANSDSLISYTLLSGTVPPGTSFDTSTGLLSGTYSNSNNGTFTFTIQATDQELQVNTQTFTVSIVLNDPQFNYTTLLLNGETSVMPAIKDVSTSNHALTIAGDVYATPMHPFLGNGYYSVMGSGADYIQVASSSTFAFPGAFTVEGWFFWTTIPSAGTLLGGNAGNSFNYYTDGTYLGFNQYGVGNICTIAALPSRNVWHHIAMTRDASNLCTIWVDGVPSSTATSAASFAQTDFIVYGVSSGGSGSGLVTNVRVIKGRAIYTSTFTVSTVPLTLTTDTVLLTCVSNSFKDISTYSGAITSSGSPAVSQNTPFTSSTSTSWGSVYFDKNSDYIATPLSAYRAFDQTVPYTIEAWVYPTTGNGNQYIYANLSNPYNGLVYNGSSFGLDTAYVGVSIIGSGSQKPLQWHHVAVTYDGTTTRLFANGVLVGSYNGTGGTGASNPLYIGNYQNGITTNGFGGYISNFRTAKGAIYTAAFNPPTAPFTTSTTGTNLLTLQYRGGVSNIGIVDSGPFNFPITRTGNVRPGSSSPFAPQSWSTYFDGSGDYLTIAANQAFYFGTNNFCIEAWIYPLTSGGSGIITSHQIGGEWMFYVNASNRFVFMINQSNGASSSYGTITCSSTTVPVNTWTHIAAVRDGAICYAYVNGVRDATTLSMSGITVGSYGGNKPVYIGAGGDVGNYYTGYVSNARIVNGSAVYTGTFTVSTTPLSPMEFGTTATSSATMLLTCAGPSFIDYSRNNFSITRNGNAVVTTFNPFGSLKVPEPKSYSVLGNASDAWIQGPAITTVGTNTNVTFECWVYFTGTDGTRYDMYLGSNNDATYPFLLYRDTNNSLYWYESGALITFAGFTAAAYGNKWVHIAVVRNNGTTTMYINGQVAGSPFADTINYNVTKIYILKNVSGFFFSGYMSNFRITTSALYTTTFAVSQTPLTAITGTVLLTCQSPTIVDNSQTPPRSLVGLGAHAVSRFNPFGTTSTGFRSYSPTEHGGSLYFDGTGDYLILPYNAAMNIPASTPMCFEAWVYTVTANTFVMANRNWAYGSSGPTYSFHLNNGVTPEWGIAGTGQTTYQMAISPISGTLGAWNHYVYSRDAKNVVRIFVNGKLGVQRTDSQALTSNSGNMYFGVSSNGASPVANGFMSDARLTIGDVPSIYATTSTTANAICFIPPTISYASTSNSVINSSTVVALAGNHAAIIDHRCDSVIETTNNVQVSTSIKKFNNASLYFDGTGDWLQLLNTPNLNFGSGNFTIEGWVNVASIDATYRGVFSVGNPVQVYTRSGTIEVYFNDSDDTTSYIVNGMLGPANSIAANTWAHFAVVRNGTTWTAYVNGVPGTPVTAGGSVAASVNGAQVGAVVSTYPYTGYMDDIRITKGYARYTTTFVTPVVSFTTK